MHGHEVTTFALVMGLAGLSASASAQQAMPELLLDVDEPAIARLMSPSNYEFRAQRYYAKRFRIVHINFDVFDGAPVEFTVSPFEDLQMTLVPAPERYASADDQLRQWNGDLKYPELQLVTGESGQPPSIVRIPVTLWLRSQPEPRGFGKLPLRTISGQWFVPALRTNIVVRPIDGDPRFHIIYEEDPSRIAQMLDTPNPEATRVLEERKEFLRGLEAEKARASTEKK